MKKTTTSFNEIPGPKILQQIAKLWNFIPVFGNQVTTSTIQYMLSANNLLGNYFLIIPIIYIFLYVSTNNSYNIYHQILVKGQL